MKVNFRSFLLSDGLIFGSVAASVVLVGHSLAHGLVSFPSALTVLLLSFGFFASVRQLMSVTHTALLSVAAADKVSRLLNMDTTRPYDPSIPPEEQALSRHPDRGGLLLLSWSGRHPSEPELRDSSGAKTTALVGLSGCGKSTTAGLLMRF